MPRRNGLTCLDLSCLSCFCLLLATQTSALVLDELLLRSLYFSRTIVQCNAMLEMLTQERLRERATCTGVVDLDLLTRGSQATS
jgi:hypothetical protein